MGIKGSWSRVAGHKAYRGNLDAILRNSKKNAAELAKRQAQAEPLEEKRKK